MTTSSIRFGPALLLVLVLAAGAAAQENGTATNPSATPDPEPPATWTHVTVTDVQGWEYRDVAIQWVEEGLRLELVRSDGAAKRFRPDRITRIHDADGRDITSEVARARPKGHAESAASGNAGPAPADDSPPAGAGAPPGAVPVRLAELPDPAPQRLFGFAVDAGLGYATTTGDWFSDIDPGINYQFGVRAMVARRGYLRFLYRHQDLGEYSLYYDIDLPPTVITLALDEYQLLYGLHSPIAQGQAARSVGYFEFGASLMDHRVRETTFGQSDSESELGWVVNGGILLMLGDKVAADFSVGATWKPGLSENEAGGFVLGAHVGLAVMF